MLNQLVIVGRMTKNLEINELENGRKQAIAKIAVPRSYKNKDGVYETDFIDVILWEAVADNVSSYCKKGDLLGIKGRIQSVRENDKDLLSVVAEKVTFLSSKNSQEDNEE